MIELINVLWLLARGGPGHHKSFHEMQHDRVQKSMPLIKKSVDSVFPDKNLVQDHFVDNRSLNSPAAAIIMISMQYYTLI